MPPNTPSNGSQLRYSWHVYTKSQKNKLPPPPLRNPAYVPDTIKYAVYIVRKYNSEIIYCMKKQFGFRKGHSTSHAIITLVNKISKSLDEGKIVGGVYLDIR